MCAACTVSTVGLGERCRTVDVCTDGLATCFAGVCHCMPGTSNVSNSCGTSQSSIITASLVVCLTVQLFVGYVI